MLAPGRVWDCNASLTNGDGDFRALGTAPVLDVLLKNGSGLFDGWMRTDVHRTHTKEASLEDDTPHHVRRLRRAIFVDCFANGIVTHAIVGDGWGVKLILWGIKF